MVVLTSGDNLLSASLYMILIVLGISMNVYVLFRTRRLHRRDPEQFRNGIGICLCIMATADLIALISLALHFMLAAFHTMLAPIVHDLFCKVVTFSSQMAYTQSMWCWFFMSALRYLATKRPLQYTTLWRLPSLALSLSLVGAMIENVWLLATVGDDEMVCLLEATMPTRVYLAVHVMTSYVVPVLLVAYMDTSVLFCSISTKYADPMLQIVINRPCGEKKKLVRRFVIITLSCLVLNTPENLIRLAVAIGFDARNSQDLIPFWMVQLSHTLYYLQFIFNAFYLTTFVYDKSMMSKTNSSRQLSLSFRQRLEENGHLIRERANTVSYRATSPMPVLVRNSSCCALDRLVPEKHWL